MISAAAIRTSCTAFVAVVVALFISVGVMGPMIRFFLGSPPSFREHFVSTSSLTQAAASHTFCLAVAYILVGFLFRHPGPIGLWAKAYCASNPAILGAGFLAFKLVYETMPLLHHDIEFYTVKIGIPLATIGFVPFAACFRLGEELGTRHSFQGPQPKTNKFSTSRK